MVNGDIFLMVENSVTLEFFQYLSETDIFKAG